MYEDVPLVTVILGISTADLSDFGRGIAANYLRELSIKIRAGQDDVNTRYSLYIRDDAVRREPTT